MAVSCSHPVCDNAPVQAMMLIVGRDVDFGTETDYENYYWCAGHQTAESGLDLSAANDGYSWAWSSAESDVSEHVPDGWELLEIRTADVVKPSRVTEVPSTTIVVDEV